MNETSNCIYNYTANIVELYFNNDEYDGRRNGSGF